MRRGCSRAGSPSRHGARRSRRAPAPAAGVARAFDAALSHAGTFASNTSGACSVASSKIKPAMGVRAKPILLRIWRDVPFPSWMRRSFLRILNPSFMVGAMALIVNRDGGILVVEHTYRREVPWGLPGGWLKQAE